MRFRAAFLLGLLAALPVPRVARAQTSRFAVEIAETRRPVSPLLFGVNRRSEADYNGYAPVATPAGATDPAIAARLSADADVLAGLSVRSFRWPGGLLANQFNWQRSVDPPGERLALSPVEDRYIADRYVSYGINEFLCEVERLVSEGKAFRDDDGYLPVVITLPGVQPAESLFFQAWSKKLDADADARYRTTPGVPLDQLAADLYEYLNAPVGLNPGPVNPKVAENVDWAAVRAGVACPGAAAPHAAPFKVRYFEAGNETRAPGWGKLYAELNLVPIATALRRVQAAIPGAKLEIGAVMLDNFAAYLDGWRQWQTDVLSFTGGVGGPNSACALADGAKVRCLDAWIMHYYTPGNWGAAHGVDLRADSDVLETTRRLPAGTYRFEYTAAADDPGGSPSLKLEVLAGGETRLTQTNAALSAAAARNAATAAVTFASAADVTVRLTPSGVGTGGGGPISVYPLLAAIRTDAAGRAEYFDLTMARAAHLAAMSAALYDEAQLNDPSLAGLPIWVTEMHPEIETPASQVQGVAMRDALQLAMAYFVLIRSGNVTMAQIWEAFQQEWYGLVEGVAFDPREGRDLARAETRLRPTALLLKLLAETTLARGAVVTAAPGNPVYSTGPEAQGAEATFVRIGMGGNSDGFTDASAPKRLSVGYVQALATVDASASKASVLLINLDPDQARPAELAFSRGLREGASVTARTLRGEGGLAATNEFLGDLAVPLTCATNEAVRGLLPGFSPCVNGGGPDASMTVSLCSEPGCPADAVRVQATPVSASANEASIVLPPASVSVMEVSLQ